MITLCFLAAQGGCGPQLTSHAAANMRFGNDRALPIQAISQRLPFIGYPRSLNALRTDKVDIILNDQRRAFSDAYVNQILATSECYVEIFEHSPLAQQESLTAGELKTVPCILVASPHQRNNEETYYREIVGLDGEFLFAENLEQARLLVAGGKGFLPVDGIPMSHAVTAPLHRVPLLRDGRPVLRNYCAFWKTGNQNPHIEEFFDVLKSQFA